ncbi:hypothetical protein EBB54_09715 [Schaedlerella arabinosiphila]|jgi:hypothetical protein|uniref:Uncharacterized protein n=1 Tax=Schaedlerella arabinosiphila TaxID=2044587 RepID=A0A3R8LED9_9FIRM|nr:hypothetical protein [Schaedlerella arabinosiphila]RRK31603.1 hypothetical protein EBB54_09715 [Schaedlerella arabinosiphila]
MNKKKKTSADIQCPLLKRYKAHKKSFTSKSGTKSMINTLFETRSTHALEESLKKDQLYQRKEKKVEEALRKIDRMGLDQEQLNAVDDALSICNYHDSQYGRIAYSLGFKDAVHLIMELFAD